MHIFQKFFLDHELLGNPISAQGDFIYRLERESYFGGLTQVFRHSGFEFGDGDGLVYLDVNSMYPYQMSTLAVPTKPGEYHDDYDDCPRPPTAVLPGALYVLTQFEFAEETPLTNFPVRSAKTKETVYPRVFHSGDAGLKHVVVWGSAINLARQHLGLRSLTIRADIRYAEEHVLYADFVKYLFEAKKAAKGQKGKYQLIKDLLNSSTGKNGQRPAGRRKYVPWEEVVVGGASSLDGGKLAALYPLYGQENCGKLSGVRRVTARVAEVLYEPNELDTRCPGALVRIISRITQGARDLLIRTISEIGVREHVFYCDTDSIVFHRSRLPFISHPIGGQLGQFEDQFPDQDIIAADFIAPKAYYCVLAEKEGRPGHPKGERTEYLRFKGVRKPTIAMLREIRLTGSSSVIQDFWSRCYGTVKTAKVRKVLNLHTKRFVHFDGSTRPFEDFEEFLMTKKCLLVYDADTYTFMYV